MDPDKIARIGKSLGLTGQPLADYILKAEEREERARERSLERATLRVRELEATRPQAPSGPQISSLKMIPFKDGDDLTSYLTRFERVADLSGWDDKKKAICLCSLLQDKALNIFSSFPNDVSESYARLKPALLNAFKLTEEHYRKQFRSARLQPDCTFLQLGVELERKLDSWI